MTTISDTQCVLLSSASQRQNGSVFPLPETISPGGGTTKALAALLKRGFAEERETNDTSAVRRAEGDLNYGLFITPAGATAIGVELPGSMVGGVDERTATADPASAPAPTTPKAPTKAATVLALLGRPEGATLPELIEATGWLPHTTRAALTGTRKKGHEVTRGKRDGVTCYGIAANA